MGEAPKLLLEKDRPIGWIVFNQPEKRNAVSQEMWQLMPDYVRDLAADDVIRVVVLRGAGDKAFVAGADISQFKDRRRNMEDEEEYRRIGARGREALNALTKPLLAMIHGYCVGGGVGIAIACDIRIASDDARRHDEPAHGHGSLSPVDSQRPGSVRRGCDLAHQPRHERPRGDPG